MKVNQKSINLNTGVRHYFCIKINMLALKALLIFGCIICLMIKILAWSNYFMICVLFKPAAPDGWNGHSPKRPSGIRQEDMQVFTPYGAWLHGCMAAWLHGAWLHGCMAAWCMAHGCIAVWCMAAWLHGCMATWLHGCMVHGCMQ